MGELPGKPATASIKLGSERFKALGEAEKQKYQKQYEQAKAQYETDLAAFKAAGGEMKKIEKKVKKEKKTKDPNKPKKPAGGAYGCYLAKNRAAFMKECQGKPITAVSKLAGERWKSLSASEKKPFEQEYEKKKAAYEAAMKDYVPPAETAGDDEEQDEDDEDEDEDGQDEEVDEEPSPRNQRRRRRQGQMTALPKRRHSVMLVNSQLSWTTPRLKLRVHLHRKYWRLSKSKKEKSFKRGKLCLVHNCF